MAHSQQQPGFVGCRLPSLADPSRNRETLPGTNHAVTQVPQVPAIGYIGGHWGPPVGMLDRDRVVAGGDPGGGGGGAGGRVPQYV